MFVYFVSACSSGCVQNSCNKCRVPRLWEKWKKRKQEKNEKKKHGKRGKDFFLKISIRCMLGWDRQ